MNPNPPGFIDRAPRLPLKTAVVFDCAEGKVKGRTVNISESGMLAVFDRPLDIWLPGRIMGVVGGWYVDVRVRVVRVDGRTAALAFEGLTESSRAAIQKLVEQSDEVLV
jgi:hypothetical protein